MKIIMIAVLASVWVGCGVPKQTQNQRQTNHTTTTSGNEQVAIDTTTENDGA